MTAIVFDFISERVRRGVRPQLTMVEAARYRPGTVHHFISTHQPHNRAEVDAFLLKLETEYRKDWF